MPGLAIGVVVRGTASTGKFHGGPANADGTSPTNPNADAALTQLGLFGDWYPDPSGGWHVGYRMQPLAIAFEGSVLFY